MLRTTCLTVWLLAVTSVALATEPTHVEPTHAGPQPTHDVLPRNDFDLDGARESFFFNFDAASMSADERRAQEDHLDKLRTAKKSLHLSLPFTREHARKIAATGVANAKTIHKSAKAMLKLLKGDEQAAEVHAQGLRGSVRKAKDKVRTFRETVSSWAAPLHEYTGINRDAPDSSWTGAIFAGFRRMLVGDSRASRERYDAKLEKKRAEAAKRSYLEGVPLSGKSLRSNLRDNNVDPPLDLAPSSLEWIKSFPRFRLDGSTAPSRIPNITALRDSDDQQKEMEPYAEGAVLVMLVPFAFIILSILYYCCFCYCRCCCDTCGARNATRRYSTKDRNMARLWMFLLVAGLCCMGVIAYASSTGVSNSVDNVGFAADDSVEWAFDFVRYANASQELVDTAFDIAHDLIDTVFDAFPSEARIQEYKDCLGHGFEILDLQEAILGEVVVLNSSLGALSGLNGVNQFVDEFEVALDALPNLNELNNELVLLNQTLSVPPVDIPSAKADLAAVNNTIHAASDLPQLSNDLTTLDNTVSGFNGTVQPLKQALIQYEVSVAAMPNLTQLATDVVHEGTMSPQDPPAEQFLADLNQFNDAMLSLPNTTETKASLIAVNTTVNDIAAALDISDSISALNTSLNSLPSMDSLGDMVRNFQTFITSSRESIENIATLVRQGKQGIDLIPSLALLNNSVNAGDEAVTLLKSVNFTVATESLSVINNTIGELTCVRIILEDVVLINETLVIFPPDLSENLADVNKSIEDILADVGSLRSDITDAEREIANAEQELDNNTPDFTDLRKQINDLNATLEDTPGLQQVLDDLSAMNDTLNDAPNLDEYLTQISDLNNSLQISSLGDMAQTLEDIRASIDALPSFDPFIENLDTLGQAVDALLGPLEAAITAKTPANNNTVPGAAGIAAGITQLKDIIDGRPDNNGLITDIDSIVDDVAARPNISSLVGDIASFDSSLQDFPDVAELSGNLDDVADIRSNTADLDDLLSNGQLATMNQTILDLPDLGELKADVLDIQNSVGDIGLDSVIETLNKTTDFNRTETLETMDELLEVRGDFDEVRNTTDDARADVDEVYDEFKKLDEDRQEYYDERHSMDDEIEYYDGIRLAVWTFVVLLPFTISGCGFLGCICNKGCCSLIMVICFFPAMLLTFFFAGIQAPVGVVLADHCPVLNDLGIEALAGETINATKLFNDTEVLVIQKPTIYATDLWLHYTKCKGPPPEFITAFRRDQVSDILRRQDLNFTDQVAEFEEETEFTLRERLRAFVRRGEALVPSIDRYVYESLELIGCERTKFLYELWLEQTLCEEFAGSWALTAVMCLLMGWLMWVGVCIGSCGFKRFNSDNSQEYAADEEFDEDEFDDNEYGPDDFGEDDYRGGQQYQMSPDNSGYGQQQQQYAMQSGGGSHVQVHPHPGGASRPTQVTPMQVSYQPGYSSQQQQQGYY